ncbi:MAG: ROK family protein, partial [Candidatus Marinimicrobia bacterium]|nr:ROK family protein [Candidatus Neomarinimicrobiota bacterium]
QIGKIRSRMLAQSIAAGDRAVETIVRQAAAWLGVGCATLINLLAPDTIVLGGGLVEALPELYLEEVTRATAAHVMPPFADAYQIVVAQLGDHAGLVGAAAFARDQQQPPGKAP